MGKKMYTFILPSVVVVLVVTFTATYVTIAKRTSVVSKDESLPEADSTLVLAHILLRHGNRNPATPAYSKNPIDFENAYPEGYGELSEKGKKVAYRIGTTLHQRYKGLLGPTWNINYTDAGCTVYTRTKMSLQLMLAGLWPPTGIQVIDPSLNWQPIPFNDMTGTKEIESSKICINFETLKQEVENSTEIQQALSVYDQYYEYLSNMTGDNITNYNDSFNIFMDQTAQLAYGYPLEDWMMEALPLFEKIVKDIYYIETNTTDLKKITGGYLLKKMITDSQAKINGTEEPQGRKMFIYSGHERNLAFLMRALDVYDDKIPPYGTHILVELHLVNEVYGFKIYHQDWSTPAPKLLTIPGCRAFCPFDKFQTLVQGVIPEDDFCILS